MVHLYVFKSLHAVFFSSTQIFLVQKITNTSTVGITLYHQPALLFNEKQDMGGILSFEKGDQSTGPTKIMIIKTKTKVTND